MKAFLYMFVMAAFFFLAFGEAPASREGTPGADMQQLVNEAASAAEGLDFECDGYAISVVAQQLGVEVYWDSLVAREGYWGYASGNEVHMEIGSCHECTKNVFFHEIGHILLGHTDVTCNKDYESEMEVEADYFAYYVLAEIGQHVRWCNSQFNNH